MLITCASCTTQFQLDDDRVPFEGIRVRCSICKSAFFVPHPDAFPEEDDPVAQRAQEGLAAAEGAAPDVAHDLDAREGARAPDGPSVDESWEFDAADESASTGPAPVHSFEAGFAAARFAVDELLGGEPATAPAPGETGAFEAVVGDDEPEIWSEPESAPEGDPAPPADAMREPTALLEHADEEGALPPLDEPAGFAGPDAAGAAPERAEAPTPAVEPDAVVPDAWPAFPPEPALEALPEPARRAAETLAASESPAQAGGGPLDAIASEDDDGPLELDDGSEADEDAPLETDWELEPEPPAAESVEPRWQPAAPDAALGSSIGLGTPLPLASGPRVAALWLARAGHAAGWVAVLSLVGAALAATLAPSLGAGRRAAMQAVVGLEAHAVSGSWLASERVGSVYVIRGELRNPGAEPKAPGDRLVVRLLDGAGATLAAAAAPVATPLGEGWLRAASPDALREAAASGAERLAATPVAPGASVPFEAVVVGLPEEARRFELAPQPGARGVEGS